MPEVSRSQLAVYGAVAIVLLLIGARAIRAEGSGGSGDPGAGDGEPTPSVASFRVSEEGGGDVVIDVAGAVGRPGVYRLPAGARVVDAIRRAGGALPTALLGAVNRAARLADGQQVVIPERVPAGRGGATLGVAGSAGTEDGPISLGTATPEQLDTIEGIGPVTAAGIIEYRDQHGGLASVEQLDQVSGIGPATMEALRSRLQP